MGRVLMGNLAIGPIGGDFPEALLTTAKKRAPEG
jgi:hypothetical protein